MLELRNINKVYNPGSVTEMCLFNDFNLSVAEGEFLSIVGSNGSGKTSLLNIICGSIPIEDGQVLFAGEDVTGLEDYKRYERMGRVYQNPALGSCPNLTLLENMSLADNKGKRYGLGRSINNSRLDYYRGQLAFLNLGLENKLDVKMGELSGGQRQAAALIMSTLTPIDFLILDEHTASLDPKTAEIIMELTDEVIKNKKLTAMMVTHNLRYAVDYGSKLIMMDKGKIIFEKDGRDKEYTTVNDVLDIFTAISIELGN